MKTFFCSTTIYTKKYYTLPKANRLLNTQVTTQIPDSLVQTSLMSTRHTTLYFTFRIFLTTLNKYVIIVFGYFQLVMYTL